MDAGSTHRAKLLADLAESDAVIVAEADSPDPVAQRQVTEALGSKLRILNALDRWEEAATVADELLSGSRPLSDLHRLVVLSRQSVALWSLDPRDPRIIEIADAMRRLSGQIDQPTIVNSLVASVLAYKALVLQRSGQLTAAMETNAELVDRAASLPKLTVLVAEALRHWAWCALREPGHLSEALMISRRLQDRVEREPDATLATVADIAFEHVRDLMRVGSPDPRGLVRFVSMGLAGVAAEGLRMGQESLVPRPLSGMTARVATPVEGLIGRAGPRADHRRRLTRALAVSQALEDRIGASGDPHLRRVAARTKLYHATVFMLLGELREGWRAISAVSAEEPGAAQAFEAESAEHAGQSGGLWQSLNSVVFLRMRAEALGRGDEAVAGLAFRDSIERLPETQRNRRAVRLAVRLLGFRGSGTVTVPDHLPADMLG